MLAQMARQILKLQAQLKKLANLRMLHIKSGVAKLPRESVVRIFVFPGANQASQTVQCFGIKRQRLAYLTRGGAPAISDDVGSHRRAQFSIAFVHILNCLFPLISARKVEIDVRPLSTLLGKKPLKEKAHFHGIDGGDAQRIADRAICRRSAALHQNAALTAKADNVPYDQEVAFKTELFNQVQFTFDLQPRAFVIWSIA